ncbi:tyrosine-type recombinase/integrase [Pandoraea anhela]|nr:integrase arm-type DNA-binding domain-containing protein [Pandoraea anhela]
MAKTVSRQLHRLNAIKVAKEVTPGLHSDGGGLYLNISLSGSRAWVFRFSLAKRAREMGLGPLSSVSLAEARALASNYRKMLADGLDPIEARRDQKRQEQAERLATMTFKEAAEAYMESLEPSWKNPKHAQQWRNTLRDYAYPVLANVYVADVDVTAILRVLRPIWSKKTETANRLRGRIERILDAARVLGMRTGENPARWRGNLDKILPKYERTRRTQHHPALAWADIPSFVRDLRERKDATAEMLYLTILTCARTNEMLEARASEFDLDRAVWNVPAERMKMGRPHRVPLCPAAVASVRRAIEKSGTDGYLFPGRKKGKPCSNMAMLNLLGRMGRDDITVHGFRSTFRDWVAECTEHPDSLAEMALAHVVGNKVEGAYRRGDMLERRRPLMERWADYCDGKAGAVISLAPAVAA